MLPSERLQIGAGYSRRDLSIKFKIALALLQRTVVRAGGYPSIWLFVEGLSGTNAATVPSSEAANMLDELERHAALGIEILLFTRDAAADRGAYTYRGPVTFEGRDADSIWFVTPGGGLNR